MPFSVPSSLSPHICIASSSDLDNLLLSSSLPPLHHILQSFSPFPHGNLDTTLFEYITFPFLTNVVQSQHAQLLLYLSHTPLLLFDFQL